MSERSLCQTLSRLKDHERTQNLGCTLPGAPRGDVGHHELAFHTICQS